MNTNTPPLPLRRRVSRDERRKNLALEFVRCSWHNAAGLIVARSLDHPEAKWLLALFQPETVSALSWTEKEERLRAWLEQHPEDATALRLLAIVLDDDEMLRRAAEFGDAVAMVELAEKSLREPAENFAWAWSSAARENARGMYELSQFFQGGVGCIKDEARSRELLRRAAELGHYKAVEVFACSVPNREKRLAMLCDVLPYSVQSLENFCFELKHVLSAFVQNGGGCRAVFEAGEILKGKIDWNNRTVFGYRARSDISDCRRAVELHDSLCDAAREVCVLWILIAKKLRFHKDARKIIAKILWDARREGRDR